MKASSISWKSDLVYYTLQLYRCCSVLPFDFSRCPGININDDIGSGNWRYRVVGQTKWNKQNCSVGTRRCAAFAVFSDMSYYFMCLRSATRVNIFEGSTRLFLTSYLRREGGKKIARETTFNLNFEKSCVFDRFQFRYRYMYISFACVWSNVVVSCHAYWKAFQVRNG